MFFALAVCFIIGVNELFTDPAGVGVYDGFLQQKWIGKDLIDFGLFFKQRFASTSSDSCTRRRISPSCKNIRLQCAFAVSIRRWVLQDGFKIGVYDKRRILLVFPIFELEYISILVGQHGFSRCCVYTLAISFVSLEFVRSVKMR